MDDLYGEPNATLPGTVIASEAWQSTEHQDIRHRYDMLALNYVTIHDGPTFEQWLARIEAAGLNSIDTETTSLDAMRARAVAAGRGAGQAQALARKPNSPQTGPAHQIRPPCVRQPRH